MNGGSPPLAKPWCQFCGNDNPDRLRAVEMTVKVLDKSGKPLETFGLILCSSCVQEWNVLTPFRLNLHA